MLKKSILWSKAHKKTSIAIAIIAILGIGYYSYSSAAGSGKVTKYVLSEASKNTVISTVSGTGQISASSQVDLKAKASGDVTAVKVKGGDIVKAGQVLVQLDASDVYKSVRDAEINLQTAQIAYEKATRGAQPEDLVTTELSLSEAKASVEKSRLNAQDDLADSYTAVKTAILDTYNKYDDTINRQMQGVYTDSSIYAKLNIITVDSQSESNATSLRAEAIESLAKLKKLAANYPTDTAEIDQALDDTIKYAKVLQKYLNSLNDMITGAIPSMSVSQTNINSYKSSVLSLISSINTTVNSLTAQKKAVGDQITTNAENIIAAENTLTRAQNSYDVLTAELDPLDLQSQKISLQQKVNALSDARTAYADYTIKAPFDGQVASVSVKKGDDISSGSAIATVISPNKVAELTLNEVDIAKVKVGQKASLTFDAIADLELTGSVAELDMVGTVTQGVVSYTVTISLDANDDRIKPGMSVTASIITDTKLDVLTVPNSAVKSKNGEYYVLTLPSASADSVGDSAGVESDIAPTQTTVTIGLADETNTEILTGLNENDIVVSKTTTVAKSASTASAPSLMQSLMPGRTSGKTTTGASSGTTKATSGSSSGSGSAAGGFNHAE